MTTVVQYPVVPGTELEESRRACREASPCSRPCRQIANWQKRTCGCRGAPTTPWVADQVGLGRRALQLAEDLGDTETALDEGGWSHFAPGPDGGVEEMNRSSRTHNGRASLNGRAKRTCGSWTWLCRCAALRRGRPPPGPRAGVLQRPRARAVPPLLAFLPGAAVTSPGSLGAGGRDGRHGLRIPRTSIIPAHHRLGRARAGPGPAGGPGHRPLLDEAWALAEPTRELCGLAP